MYRIAAVMLTLVLPLLALRAGEFDAEARARTIAPFVDGQTVGVLHIDLSRIDADAILDWAVEVGRLEKRELEAPRHALRGWLTNFTKAGGKDLYVIVNLVDLPMEPPLVVVPLAAGADAKALRGVLGQVEGLKLLH